jgi:anti-sigma regulatory factor (Ser/Thr protein kinase)
VTDAAVLVVSEFATNAVVHSASRDGGTFTFRAEISDNVLHRGIRRRRTVEPAGAERRQAARTGRNRGDHRTR